MGFEIDSEKFKILVDPVTAESLRQRFGKDCLPSMPRPQQIIEDTTQLL